MQSLIGIDLADLRRPAKEAMQAASRLQFAAIQLPATDPEISPQQLDASGRRHLARFADALSLKLAALSADLPGLRLTDPKTVDERVEKTMQIIQLARELRVPIVTASVGQLTHPASGEPSSLAAQALARIGEFADSRGVRYAIRPTHDTAARLAKVLDALRCPSIQIGLDPAAMVMTGANPLSDVERYAPSIAHFHVRDATAGLPDRPGHETALGEGDVDLMGCLMVLQAADYRGAHILRRTESPRPVEDLLAAKKKLEQLLSEV